MSSLKRALKFALCLLPIAVVGGVFTGIYCLDLYSGEIISEVVSQLGSAEMLIVVATVQTIAYALFCGFFGYMLAEKTGLWKPIRFAKKPLAIALLSGAVCGAIFAMDYWVCGSFIDGIQAADRSGMTLSGALSSILYGGMIEEVMLRLFFMSLIALILIKLLCRKRETIPTGVFAAANILASIAFAAGHLPATAMTFGELTLTLVVRCFLLNGAFGVVFGRLYRRYGIHYAMLAHVVFHIMSKLIWLIFI